MQVTARDSGLPIYLEKTTKDSSILQARAVRESPPGTVTVTVEFPADPTGVVLYINIQVTSTPSPHKQGHTRTSVSGLSGLGKVGWLHDILIGYSLELPPSRILNLITQMAKSTEQRPS